MQTKYLEKLLAKYANQKDTFGLLVEHKLDWSLLIFVAEKKKSGVLYWVSTTKSKLFLLLCHWISSNFSSYTCQSNGQAWNV